MFWKQGLTLRLKILLLLTLLPLFMLGTYLYIILNVFKSDKLAYVFESSATTTQNLSMQASTSIRSILSISRPIIEDFYANDSFAQISKAIMTVDNPITWVAAFHLKSNQNFERLSVVEKSEGLAQAELKDLPNLLVDLIRAEKENIVVHVPFRDERVLTYLKTGSKVFAIMALIPDLNKTFKAQGVMQSYLVKTDGEILLGPIDSSSKSFVEKVGEPFFNRLSEQKATSGTEKIKAGLTEDYLASFAKSGVADLVVVSFIPQSEALKAITTIVIRSVLFALLLVSLSVFISLVASGNLTAALTDLYEATKKVASGQFDIRVDVKTNDEVGALSISFNKMAEQVSVLMAETAEKSRMEAELKTAQTVQETLFPALSAELGPLKVVGHYEPASECGGDWWHYSETKDRVYFWIGDATGHGVPAALLTSAAKSAVALIESLNVDTATAMYMLNQSIHEVAKGKMMMTFFVGCFDKYRKVFTYSNASHDPPFLIHRAEEDPAKNDLVLLQEGTGYRLGQHRDSKYEITEVPFQKGDRIFFYTDGVFDIKGTDDKPLGERRFIKNLLEVNKGYPSIDVSMQNLIRITNDFRQGSALVDDVTFFMCEYVDESV